MRAYSKTRKINKLIQRIEVEKKVVNQWKRRLINEDWECRSGKGRNSDDLIIIVRKARKRVGVGEHFTEFASALASCNKLAIGC